MSPCSSDGEARPDRPGSGHSPGLGGATATSITGTAGNVASTPLPKAGNTTKLRRAHRKSRNGCWECKRRHIKCDEARPACSNCVVSERTCSFPRNAVSNPTIVAASDGFVTASSQIVPSASLAGVLRSPARSPAESSSSSNTIYPQQTLAPTVYGYRGFPVVDEAAPPTLPSFNEFFSGSPSSSLPDAPPPPVFSAKHLILLHHAETAMPYTTSFMPPILTIAVDWAQECPYAMDQLLALAADHLAMRSPDTSHTHRRTATELQTRALMWFNRDIQENPSQPNDRICIPRFLFASLLSIHLIYETLTYHRSSYHAFIDHFIESTHLHRGVRTVINTSYDLILETPLRPFLLNFRTTPEADYSNAECAELERIIETSDLAPATVAACKSACRTLQWAFNMHASLPPDGNIHAATAFPVLLTSEYVEALRKNRPEALLVLAYYGVLLHRCRRSWIIGDSGYFLIHLIADYLGSFWQEPMRWPLQVLANEQG
ncbi:hypothetical protein BGZ63DRAFT_406967 [Mariannaea sp. PMI_226]|nr:hypothetical protein BGZ63DRAFT_406967 [Mariannaea sp. PMI_226]